MQAVSVLLIAFRMSFLLIVQLDTLLLPLIAFSGILWRDLRHKSLDRGARWSGLRTCGVHLLVSATLMFVLHTGYKQLTGSLFNREPAYLHATGITLLAFLSPILEPRDSSDPALADLIRHGDELELKTFSLRNSQRFSPGRLIDRWSKLQPDSRTADALAKQTAFHALLRDPLGVAGLAWQTYSIYWSVGAMKQCAYLDFGFSNQPDEALLALLASRFHLALNNSDHSLTVLQQYYLAAWPYYFLILISPLLAALVARAAMGA